MRLLKHLVLLCSLSFGLVWIAQPAFANTDPLDIVFYTISANYSPDTYTISAQQTATYVNTTDDPIPDVVLHLYLNAFRNTGTTWMREAGSILRGYAFDPSHPGSINIDTVHLADGTQLEIKPMDADNTLARAVLPVPVDPGNSVTLDLTFTAVLPRVFARTGWADDGNFVLAGQWFPKFGVWQQGTWNAYLFHANSEFYADFGTYKVNLTLPEEWNVGASAPAGDRIINNDGTVTHKFHEEHIIDFVWTASPRYREITREYNGISVRVLYYPMQSASARRSLETTLQGLELFGEWYGPYGNGYYSHLTVVMVPTDAGGAGGMEYPTLFTVGALAPFPVPKCLKLIEVETAHELAHQWFQSVIATNEAEEPWLDEGFADYSTTRVMRELYDGAISTCGNWNFSYLALQRMSYLMYPEIKMSGRAWDFGLEYSIATYAKPIVSLSTLEGMVGEEKMLDFLQAYYQRHAFTHPTAENLEQVMLEVLGQDVSSWFFDQLVHGDGTMDAYVAEFASDHVTVQRDGDLCVQTAVRLTPKTGPLQPPTTRDVPWTCDTPSLRVDGNFTEVDIDPKNAIPIDTNLANNNVQRPARLQTFFGLVARVMKSLQNFYWGGSPW